MSKIFKKFSHHIFRRSIRTIASKRLNALYSVKVDNSQEIVNGKLETKKFQAETKRLLDIVANSLYSEKEVFVRELVSNATDALEKYRYLQSSGVESGNPLEIKITTDKEKGLFIIEVQFTYSRILGLE